MSRTPILEPRQVLIISSVDIDATYANNCGKPTLATMFVRFSQGRKADHRSTNRAAVWRE